jgi:hypothetical protein
MAEARRFPPPWSVDELEACFVVKSPGSVLPRNRKPRTV